MLSEKKATFTLGKECKTILFMTNVLENSMPLTPTLGLGDEANVTKYKLMRFQYPFKIHFYYVHEV